MQAIIKSSKSALFVLKFIHYFSLFLHRGRCFTVNIAPSFVYMCSSIFAEMLILDVVILFYGSSAKSVVVVFAKSEKEEFISGFNYCQVLTYHSWASSTPSPAD